MTLSRCAYTGAQKFGTLVWSGDIPSTFESLRMQVKSGLNMSMCAIPWWTTDIGGFYGGDTESDYFRELVVRWFQYIKKHMDIASQKGIPVMRPMFFDFPDDEICYTLGGQYLFGDDIIFAPITEQGKTEKRVYLPEGQWVRTTDKIVYTGGQYIDCHAEINQFIAFVKKDAKVLNVF